MATRFLEPGGDADFGIALWPAKGAGTPPTAVADFVHGSHLRSIKFAPAAFSYLIGSGFVTDAGGRVSVWIYLNALPTTATASLFQLEQTGDGSGVAQVAVTTTGVLQLRTGNAPETQIGTNGSTLQVGTWHRLTLAWTITSTTVNTIKLFRNGAIDITATNVTLLFATSADFQIGNGDNNAGLDFRYSDLYIDNSNALTDPGNIWVTVKRPLANGTTTGFTTQVGAGTSGYGSGHTPQVNERPLSTTNGWSVTSAGSAFTEEYSIEGAGVGDTNISAASLIDYMGWVDIVSGIAETGSIVVGGVSSAISITTAAKVFIKVAGSAVYPAGGTDIGVITATTSTTVTLYEAGLVLAYIPGTTPPLPPVRLANRNTGPRALRQRFRQLTVLTATASSSFTGTATQPASARIATIPVKTQPVTGRIATTRTSTEPATARIATNPSAAQPATGRVANVVSKTQPAVARVQQARTGTQPATARVQQPLTKTQPATARIANSPTKTQPVLARVAKAVSTTQPATAHITAAVTKTQPGISRIALNTTKVQSATVRMAQVGSKTQPSTARIASSVSKTEPAMEQCLRPVDRQM